MAFETQFWRVAFTTSTAEARLGLLRLQIKEQHKKEKELSKLASQELELIERLQKKQAEQVQHRPSLTRPFAGSACRRLVAHNPAGAAVRPREGPLSGVRGGDAARGV